MMPSGRRFSSRVKIATASFTKICREGILFSFHRRLFKGVLCSNSVLEGSFKDKVVHDAELR